MAQLAQQNAKLPAYLRKPCRAASTPGMTVGAIRKGWAADRDALADCDERKEATHEFYEGRDAGLAEK